MKIIVYSNGQAKADRERSHPWVPGAAFIANPELEPLLRALEESGIETAEEFRARLKPSACTCRHDTEQYPHLWECPRA